VSTATQVAADLTGLAVEVVEKRHRIVVHHGALLQTHVRRHASKPRTGPPGPRLLTGNYVRSINRRTTRLPTMSMAEVGTNAPQGRRLELGFTGTDSLNREYDQPPYPHFAPGLEEVRELFAAALLVAGLPTTRETFR
jgi:hypothetical protein